MNWLDLSTNSNTVTPSHRRASISHPPEGPKNQSSYYYYNPKRIGISTLKNLGNTCYFNSVLQCLAHTHPLTEYILQSQNTPDCNNRLWYDYKKLVKTMWYGNYKLTPKTIYDTFRLAYKKSDEEQEDAHEILNFILDHFHEALKYQVVYKDLNEHHLIKASLKALNQTPMSPINNIFLGQLHQRTQCTECRYTSHTFPPFKDVILSLKTSSEFQSLYMLLNQFCHRETLEDSWNCEKCGKKGVTAHQKTTFWRLPKILTFVLKRFDPYGRKNQKHIDYPITDLNLSKYMTYPDNARHVYHLYALSCHLGSTTMGHYYSICHINGEWVILNDDNVEYIRQDDVITPQAYTLFYERDCGH